MHKPPKTLLPALEALLSTRPENVANAIREVVNDVRPCVRLESTRASPIPIRGPWFDRILRRPPPAPVLPLTTSKFGGIPYVENSADLAGARFIGQINFAEAFAALSADGFPIPSGMPRAGLLAFDLKPKALSGRARWYPEPSEANAATPAPFEPVAKYEARISFRGSWSLQGLSWFDAVPSKDDELWEAMNELEIEGVDEYMRGGHTLFGHTAEALNEHYGLSPVPGRSSDIRDYALVWRLDYDNAAGFSWGTNWLYAVIHADDRARGAFENTIVTGANA